MPSAGLVFSKQIDVVWTTLQIYTVLNCVHFPLQFRCTVYIFYHIQSNVEITLKKNCKSVYNYFIVIGAAIKCNPYSETTVESQTQLKTVKNTLNIFTVYYQSKKGGKYLEMLFAPL